MDSAPPRDALEIEVERRLGQEYGEGGSGLLTIFRVPSHVRAANKELYEPRLVSIGPYYRGREELRAMEQHKWRYLRELVARRPGASLAAYVRAVRNVERRAQRCYSERTNIFDAVAGHGGPSGVGTEDGQGRGDHRSDEFAEMLLLDGCFILEFFIKWHRKVADKLCDVGWVLGQLHADLLLLENQIPFFVLEELFRVAAPAAERFDLRRLILPHLKLDYSTFEEWSTLDRCEYLRTLEIHHLLHLFYEAFLPSSLPQCVTRGMPDPRTQQQQASPPPPPLTVPSVTMLRDAGVWFEKKTSPMHMFDITFDKAKGIMSMPRIQVHQANIPLLVNLIAFEQTRDLRDTSLPLSSYAALMSFLVKTGKDVEQLQKQGIIDNLLSSDDDAATSFFQQQGGCSSLNYENHLFATMFADLNQYYESRWHKHRAEFLQDYCSSPWAMIASGVAVFVFFLGIFNFVTDIRSLVHHNH